MCGYLMFNQKKVGGGRKSKTQRKAGCVMPGASQHASLNAAPLCLLGSSLLSRVVCYFLLTSSPHQPEHLFNPTRWNFARSWVWCLRLLDDKIDKGWRVKGKKRIAGRSMSEEITTLAPAQFSMMARVSYRSAMSFKSPLHFLDGLVFFVISSCWCWGRWLLVRRLCVFIFQLMKSF